MSTQISQNTGLKKNIGIAELNRIKMISSINEKSELTPEKINAWFWKIAFGLLTLIAIVMLSACSPSVEVLEGHTSSTSSIKNSDPRADIATLTASASSGGELVYNGESSSTVGIVSGK